jgi:hypothetical protein
MSTTSAARESDELLVLGAHVGSDGFVARHRARYRGRDVEVRTLDVDDALAANALPDGNADCERARELPEALCVPVLGIVRRAAPIVFTAVPNGVRLPARVAEGTLDRQAALWVARDTACALEAAHALSLPHGAFRPDAVVVLDDGSARVDDWVVGRGLFRVAQSNERTLVATARYSAPELAARTVPGSAADVFAWAATFYEVLTGRVAFSGSTPMEQVMATSLGTLPPMDALAEIDASLPSLFTRAFSVSVAARPSAADLVRALDAVLGERDPRKPEPLPTVPQTDASLAAACAPIDPLDLETLRQMEIPNHVPDEAGYAPGGPAPEEAPTGFIMRAFPRRYVPQDVDENALTMRAGMVTELPVVKLEAAPTPTLVLDVSATIDRDDEPARPRAKERESLPPVLFWTITLMTAVLVVLLVGIVGVWLGG